MSVSLSLFPILDENIYMKIGFEASPFEFYYYYHGEKRPLEVKGLGDGTSFGLVDPKGDWNPDEFGFTLRRECVIRHPDTLFGSGGVAPSSATIGLAAMWLSRSSKTRGCVRFNESIRRSQTPAVRTFEHTFAPGTFRGQITLNTVIFLDECSYYGKENQFAKHPGTLLGELDSCKVIIDGQGSVFPIVEVDEPSQPLWRVECNWNDPLVESFDAESVVVCLNRAHPAYKELMRENMKQSYLLKEVVAGALHIIVQNAQTSEFWADILDGKSDEGSIGEALHYFVKTLEWNTSTPERLAWSIRDYLDRGM